MIDRLFELAGCDDRYTDAFGSPVVVSTEAKFAILNALGYDVQDDESASEAYFQEKLAQDSRRVQPVYVVKVGKSARWPSELLDVLDPNTTIGYYPIEIGGTPTTAIVVPEHAYVPDGMEEARPFGIAAQLYSLRSKKNWGIGDFGDLLNLVDVAKRAGASAVALNPLHQLPLSNPTAASPYAPLSRKFLNGLYIDVDWAAEKFGVVLHDIDVSALRNTTFVDYPEVAALKRRGLEQIFDAIDSSAIVEAFEHDHRDVRLVATYEAIMEHVRMTDPSAYSWLQWPLALRDSDGEPVKRFQQVHHRRIAYFIFLQYLADRQLSEVAASARTMAIGLYRDLAVGVDLASADVWADPHAFAIGLSVGAPPDLLAPLGQNWGLPPLHPRVLAQRAYQPFIELVHANMQHAGALRIDHVMGLKRLFCMPRSNPKLGGAYINYDLDAMLGIVALESQRNRCMIVGEDLGTVPEGFRERLEPERAFSTRVLMFERNPEGGFRAPHEYPRDSVASTGTHDLAPLSGFWTEEDVATREHLGLGSEEMSRRDRAERDTARQALVRAFEEHGCIAPEDAQALREAGPSLSDEHMRKLLVAAHRYLARSSSRLVLVQLEDALGQREPVNVPGSVDEAPNWKRKLSATVEDLESHDIFASLAAVMREERPGGHP